MTSVDGGHVHATWLTRVVLNVGCRLLITVLAVGHGSRHRALTVQVDFSIPNFRYAYYYCEPNALSTLPEAPQFRLQAIVAVNRTFE
jgi:hypothetical protein